MSIDLIAGERHVRVRSFNRASVEAAVQGVAPRIVTDLVVVFGGWGAGDGGAAMPAQGGQDTGTTQLIGKLRALKSSAGSQMVVRAWHGQLRATVSEAEDFVRSQFHPIGKLILCGYSAGGFNAMALSRALHTTGYFNVNTREFLAYYHPSTNTARHVVGIARVDLLVTIDAAQGPMSSMNSRAVAPSVRRNVNVFQLNPSGTDSGTGSDVAIAPRSHGGPNTAMDESATRVENHDWTARYAASPRAGHGTIDNDAIETVVSAVRAELGG